MIFTVRQDANTHKFNQHWKMCVGSGHAPYALRSDWASQLRKVHEELGISYVRFHGIFSDGMQIVNNFGDVFPIPGAEKFEEYNFRNVAAAYDNILSCGMKPWVELSFMPEHLASGKEQCFFFEEGNITPPADYDRWSDLIVKFVEFLIARYGKDEVETWFFEVWNEPDLKGFWFGTKQEYFHLYDVTARAVKSVDTELKVGGPATSGSKWIHGFLAYCKEHDCPVDYISTHQYAGDPVGMIDVDGINEEAEEKEIAFNPGANDVFGGIKKGSLLDAFRHMMSDKSETEDLPYEGLRENAEIVRKQAGNLPVYYTEWNENAIFSAFTNDTRKVAAFDVRVILETENTIDGSSIWCFSDIFQEFHLFREEFHGGFGMLTESGIPKPLYHALSMMAGLPADRLELGVEATKGEIGIAAFQDCKSLQILLFRQKMKNLDLPKEKAELLIECVKPARVEQQRIDAESGNPLKIWNEMGSPAIPSPEQVREIIEKSTPLVEEPECRWAGGRLLINAELGVNDIYLLRIIK